MKLAVEQEHKEDTIEFHLEDDGDGGILLSQKEGWDVLSLRVVEDEIVLVRHGHISDEKYSTDKKGRINLED